MSTRAPERDLRRDGRRAEERRLLAVCLVAVAYLALFPFALYALTHRPGVASFVGGVGVFGGWLLTLALAHRLAGSTAVKGLLVLLPIPAVPMALVTLMIESPGIAESGM